MYDKTPYTPGMREVIKLSKAEAIRLGNEDTIRPEHYLLGIIRKGDGLAVQTLRNLNIDLQDLKDRLEQAMQGPSEGSKAISPQEAPSSFWKKLLGTESPSEPGVFAPDAAAKRVLDKTKDIARAMKHNWIGTEHFLLGMLAETDTVPSKVLQQMGLAYSAAEQTVIDIIEGRQTGSLVMEAFTNTLRVVFFCALDEAYRMGNDYAGPEHFLLGVLRHRFGLSYEMLGKLGVDPDELKARIEERVKADHPPAGAGSVEKLNQFLADLKKWMDSLTQLEAEPQGSPEFVAAARLWLATMRITRNMGHHTSGTEHLLLALISDADTIAGQCLQSAGVTYDAALGALDELLASRRSGPIPRKCGICGSGVIEFVPGHSITCRACHASAQPEVRWVWRRGSERDPHNE